MDGQVGSIDFGGGKGGLRKLVVLAFTYYTFFFYLPLHTYTTFFFFVAGRGVHHCEVKGG